MSAPADIRANAERLISDAEYMHDNNRSRSAATLIVVALEQLGAFVEALTKQTYPDAEVHMGIFGANANAHAKRQDALAAHVMNYAFEKFYGEGVRRLVHQRATRGGRIRRLASEEGAIRSL